MKTHASRLVRFAAASLSLLMACAATPSTPPLAQAPLDIYAITDVGVVDVENGTVAPGQTVVIVGDRIDQIAPYGSALPERARTVDGRGLYLMPGLVDAHVHYQEAPIFGRVMIANGVLIVRDMGMPNEYILPLRDELNRGATLGPEMVAAGALLDGADPVIPSIAISVRTPEEGRAAVRAQAAAGVDFIKVYSKLDKQTFLAIVDEARTSGLKVVGHVPDSISIEDAASAGLQSIEHFFGFDKVVAQLLGQRVNFSYAGMGLDAGNLLRLGEIDPRALQSFYQRLYASNVTIVPTVVTFKNWPNVDTFDRNKVPNGQYISQNLLSMWKSQWAGQTEFPDAIWQNWAQMAKGMNDAGVPLMVGTDLDCPGLVPGYSVHEEMAILQEAGIAPAEVLRSATIVPARFMGLEQRLGSVTQGKQASIVLVSANPLDDIRNAEKIAGVFLRGRYYSRSDLDALLDEARRLAKGEQ